MSALRDEAEAIADALELGVCEVPEAIAWADAHLLRHPSPPAALCEVSLAHDRYPQDLANLLRQIPGSPDGSEVLGLLVTWLDARLKCDAGQADRVSEALFLLAIAERIEDDDLDGIARWAGGALDLAGAGQIEESRAQIIDQLSAALDRAARTSKVAWSFDPIGPRPEV